MQEVASPEEDNNKKGLVLASLVILLILATVALNILIFSEEEEPQPELGQRSAGIYSTAASLYQYCRLQIPHLLNSSRLLQSAFNGSWISGEVSSS